jgi:hypothetical protein
MEVLKREKKKEQTKSWVKVSIDFLMVYLFSFGESSIYPWKLRFKQRQTERIISSVSTLLLESRLFFLSHFFVFFNQCISFSTNLNLGRVRAGSPIPLSANRAHVMRLQRHRSRLKKLHLTYELH